MVFFYIKGYPSIYNKIKYIFENKKNKIQNKEGNDKKESINVVIERNDMNKNNPQKIKTNINDNDTIKSIEKKSSLSIDKIDNKINNQNVNQNSDVLNI